MLTTCPTEASITRLGPVRQTVIQKKAHGPGRKIIVHIAFVALMLSFGLPNAMAADKTDIVVMNNGDRLVGEIKGLDYGQLQFKASYMASSVNLDWEKVTQLESTRHFRVEFDDGMLLSGSIYKSNSATPDTDFQVVDSIGATTRSALHVVSLEPIEGSWLRRFRGSADVGLTLQPQTKETQWTGNASIDFPAESFRVDSQISSFFSSQEGTETSVRQSFGLAYYQFLSKNWFALGMTQLLKDNQLNLDLRSTFSGGGGRFLTHSNRKGLAVFGGVAATNEKYFDTTTNNNGTNAEFLTGMEFYSVRFASSQVKTRLLVYSGLTQWGRIRVDWDSSISWEIWNDIYWKMSAQENYDSRPPEGASHNDFTLTTSFGVSF